MGGEDCLFFGLEEVLMFGIDLYLEVSLDEFWNENDVASGKRVSGEDNGSGGATGSIIDEGADKDEVDRGADVGNDDDDDDGIDDSGVGGGGRVPYPPCLGLRLCRIPPHAVI